MLSSCHSFFKTLIAVFGLSLLLSCAAYAQDGKPTGPIDKESNQAIDAEIDSRITEIFRQIDGLDSLFVFVDAGVVVLKGTISDPSLIEKAVEIAQRVEGVVAVNEDISEETSVEVRLVPVFERITDQFSNAIRLAPLALIALFTWGLVILLGWFVSSRTFPWSKVAPNEFIADLMRRIVFLVFIIVGAILALDIMGATALIGTVLGAAGIVGLAVGFAIRDTVENFIASILLSIRQPFSPKDYVDIEGHEGNVLRLTSRATILIEPSGNHVRVPNSTVFKSVITNYTRNPQRRFEFKLGVAAESDLGKAIESGIRTLKDLSFVLKTPSADGWISEFGDSNVTLLFVGWIDQTKSNLTKARSEAMRMVKDALEADDFKLPEPIFIVKMEGDSTSAGAGSAAASAKRKAKPKPAARASDEVDVSAETAVLDQIDDELAKENSEDLLPETGEQRLE